MKRSAAQSASEMPLLPIPSSDWEEEYNGLMSSEHPMAIANGYIYLGRWLRQKTDRKSRLKEMAQYISDHAAEILHPLTGLVLDIGPGPGEFLEIARLNGNSILGVDSPLGKDGMGLGYLRVSSLMTQRQKIPVRYVGFKNWLNDPDVDMMASTSFVNFRGSFEQVFAHRMNGNHWIQKDCRMCRWMENEKTRDEFLDMFARLRTYLQPGGHILIHANGSASDHWYNETIQSTAKEAGFTLVMQGDLRLHKWKRN